MEDKHSKAVSAEVLAEAQKKIGEAASLLKPYLLNLTAQERQNNLKLGDKTLAFAQKAYAFAEVNPAFAPSYFDLDMLSIDMQDVTGLRVLQLAIDQLSQGLADTVMVAGGEAYNQALMYYHAVKQAAQQDIPGAKAIYNELRERFPGTSRPRKPAEDVLG